MANFRYVTEDKKLAVAGVWHFEDVAHHLKQGGFHVIPLFSASHPDSEHYKSMIENAGAKVHEMKYFKEPVPAALSEKHVFPTISKIEKLMKKGKVLLLCGNGSLISPVMAGTFLVANRGYSPREAARAVSLQGTEYETILFEREIAKGMKYYQQALRQPSWGQRIYRALGGAFKNLFGRKKAN